MQKNPCYGCKARHVGCHSECEKYQAARAELDKAKKQRFMEAEIDSCLASVARDARRKRKRR